MERETYFTKDPLSNTIVNEEGNTEIRTDKGVHVLTLIHPVQKTTHELSAEVIEQFRADLRLHQYASVTYEALNTIILGLEALKVGRISIFAFPLDEYIKVANAVLKRAGEKD